MIALKDAPFVAYSTGQECIAQLLRDFTHVLLAKQSEECVLAEVHLEWDPILQEKLGLWIMIVMHLL